MSIMQTFRDNKKKIMVATAGFVAVSMIQASAAKAGVFDKIKNIGNSPVKQAMKIADDTLSYDTLGKIYRDTRDSGDKDFDASYSAKDGGVASVEFDIEDTQDKMGNTPAEAKKVFDTVKEATSQMPQGFTLDADVDVTMVQRDIEKTDTKDKGKFGKFMSSMGDKLKQGSQNGDVEDAGERAGKIIAEQMGLDGAKASADTVKVGANDTTTKDSMKVTLDFEPDKDYFEDVEEGLDNLATNQTLADIQEALQDNPNITASKNEDGQIVIETNLKDVVPEKTAEGKVGNSLNGKDADSFAKIGDAISKIKAQGYNVTTETNLDAPSKGDGDIAKIAESEIMHTINSSIGAEEPSSYDDDTSSKIETESAKIVIDVEPTAQQIADEVLKPQLLTSDANDGIDDPQALAEAEASVKAQGVDVPGQKLLGKLFGRG